MNFYRARFLLTMEGAAVENGALLIHEGRVLGVGPYEELKTWVAGEPEDLGEVILLPGLINAHCHLEYTFLRNAVSASGSFTKWIQRINAAKRNQEDADFLQATAFGAEELSRFGTTAVVNIESIPEVLAQRPELPLRVWWSYEMIDVRLRSYGEEAARGAMSVFDAPAHPWQENSVSPHAPFTASPVLYRLAAEAAEKEGLLFTTHVGESQEEMMMYREAGGALFDFLAGLGRDMNDCGGTTPLRHLIERGGLRTDHLLVHLNELAAEDYPLLARWTGGRQFSVVHCPKSHAFFGHSRFPYDELLGVNANICLGTDSLASNDRLNLFEEMQRFAEQHPEVSPVEILEMVTQNPAKALGKKGALGVLREGALADFIAVPVGQVSREEVFDAVLHYRGAVPLVVVNGKKVRG